jgi:hypothetical protein
LTSCQINPALVAAVGVKAIVAIVAETGGTVEEVAGEVVAEEISKISPSALLGVIGVIGVIGVAVVVIVVMVIAALVAAVVVMVMVVVVIVRVETSGVAAEVVALGSISES